MKILIATLTLLLAAPAAFAGSCPMKISLIDKALLAGKVENIEQVKKLRAEGEKLHNSGDHAGSVRALVKAMKLGGIKS